MAKAGVPFACWHLVRASIPSADVIHLIRKIEREITRVWEAQKKNPTKQLVLLQI
jgi:hypothetical protein